MSKLLQLCPLLNVEPAFNERKKSDLNKKKEAGNEVFRQASHGTEK